MNQQENYKSAYWQNMHWKKQLKEMARNPAAVNEIGFSNFPPLVIVKILRFMSNNTTYKYLNKIS